MILLFVLIPSKSKAGSPNLVLPAASLDITAIGGIQPI
jgi:hypothetical protein